MGKLFIGETGSWENQFAGEKPIRVENRFTRKPIHLETYPLGNLFTWKTIRLENYSLGKLFTRKTYSIGNLSVWKTGSLGNLFTGRKLIYWEKPIRGENGFMGEKPIHREKPFLV